MENLDQTQQPGKRQIPPGMDRDMAPETIRPKKYLSFVEAHEFVRSLKLQNRKEWRLYVKGGLPEKPKKPDNIPAHPDGIYKMKGWQGWKYWLGTADKGLYQ